MTNTTPSAIDNHPSAIRGCHRLVAIIATRGSAESLDMHELLRLSDWVTPPVHTADRYDWAENVGVPLIQELGRRLQRSLDTQETDVPQLLAQVRSLRSSQRLLAKAKPENRAELKTLVADLEAELDKRLAADLQPSLFGD